MSDYTWATAVHSLTCPDWLQGELVDMAPIANEGKQRLTFKAPSRGLIGFRAAFVNATRGQGLMHRLHAGYAPYMGPMDQVRKGVLVSTGSETTALLTCMQQWHVLSCDAHVIHRGAFSVCW